MYDPYALDPLTTVTRLALIPFFEDTIKLSIEDNNISLHKSSNYNWIFRHLKSYLNIGYTKNCLHHLRKPVQRFKCWYDNYEDLDIIIKNAIKGLSILNNAYSTHGNTQNTLFLCEHILKSNDATIPEEDYSQLPKVKKLKEFWNPADFKQLNSYFILLSKETSSTTKPHVINLIEAFLKQHQNDILKIIREESI